MEIVFAPKILSPQWALYSLSISNLSIKGHCSDNIPLHSGMRQGCPLFLLLFIIYLEPLAYAICHHEGIKGIQTFGVEHKITLFADDLLICPVIGSLYRIFSSCWHHLGAGRFKTNTTKFVIYPICLSKLERKEIETWFVFQSMVMTLKYVGVLIPVDLRNTLQSIKPL